MNPDPVSSWLRWPRLLSGALLLLTAAGIALSGERPPATSAYPDIRLPDVDGRSRALSEWSGRPVLLNYWASWCGPCLKEMPELDAFQASQRQASQQQASQRGDPAVQVIGIALDERDSIHAYLQRRPVRYPILIEAVAPGEPGSSRQFGNAHGVLPYSVLLDARGRVVRSKLGPLTHAELQAWTAALAR